MKPPKIKPVDYSSKTNDDINYLFITLTTTGIDDEFQELWGLVEESLYVGGEGRDDGTHKRQRSAQIPRNLWQHNRFWNFWWNTKKKDIWAMIYILWHDIHILMHTIVTPILKLLHNFETIVAMVGKWHFAQLTDTFDWSPAYASHSRASTTKYNKIHKISQDNFLINFSPQSDEGGRLNVIQFVACRCCWC